MLFSFIYNSAEVRQGLMLVSDFKSARLQVQFGKPIVYVEFVATAPWNLWANVYLAMLTVRGSGRAMPRSSRSAREAARWVRPRTVSA